jgi:very-short-patch-repair endonuclease
LQFYVSFVQSQAVIDNSIGRMAATQLGLITLAQALELGLAARAARRRVASGAWARVQPTVYALRGSPDSPDRTLLAAILSLGPLAAVSHRAAAERWGLGRAEPALLDVSIARERGVHLEGVIVHRSRDLHPDHIIRAGPLPITTPVRTLVDLGQVEPWFVVRDLLEHLVAKRVTTIGAIHAGLLLHSRRGRSGCGGLRRVLEQRALLDRPTASTLEAAFAELCQLYGLPSARYQYPVTVAGTDRWIDFAYPELMLALEVDGFEFHATLEGFSSDRVRGNDLALAGWTVLHFTWHQVVHRPAYVASVLWRALRQIRTGGP